MSTPTLQRDILEITDAYHIDRIGSLLRLVAAQSANLVSFDSMARKLGLDRKAVRSYVALLEQMFLVQQLPAWRPGIGAREATTPKIYVCDSGLHAYLLGADEKQIASDDQVTGKMCETFVAVEVLKHLSWAQSVARVYHYQRDRKDVDLVIENNAGDIAGVEVKSAATLKKSDWAWLEDLRDGTGSKFKSGIVVYSGAQTTPLGDRLWAVPYAALWS